MATQDDWTRITLRLPPELFEDIKRVSGELNRSANAQIVEIIREWIEQRGSKSIPPYDFCFTAEGVEHFIQVKEAADESYADNLSIRDSAPAIAILTAFEAMPQKKQKAMLELFCDEHGLSIAETNTPTAQFNINNDNGH